MNKIGHGLRSFALFSASAILCGALSGSLPYAAAEGSAKFIIINGDTAETAENRLFGGIGAVSSGAALRLLADYKFSAPDEYNEIMNILFGKDGAVLSSIYVEMGSDINSVPCAEPAAMRSADDIPDITGNAGWQIAADALKLDPYISVRMIRTEQPRFVTDAFGESSAEGCEACYKWYKSCIEAVYDTYGIELDYISVNSDDDETIDSDRIFYLSSQLKNEKDCRYDYSGIDIGITVNDHEAASELLRNEALLSVIDVIDCRMSLESSNALLSAAEKYGIELITLGCPAPLDITDPAADNTPLDLAENIINMYSVSGITLTGVMPPAISCYSGTKYYSEGLLTADTPWSGHYTVNAGLWAAEHFTRFTEKGWEFIGSGCQTDTALTLADPESGDYSVIIVNNSSEEKLFRFGTADIGKYSARLNVWLSDFAECSYMQNIGTISPVTANGGGSFEYTLPPYSMATITTTDASPEYSEYCSADEVRLPLPYSDDFSYSENTLSLRGGLPLYINVLGGAFEVRDGSLVQTVSDTKKPVDSLFSSTPAPTASIGDDSWADYSLSADVRLASSAADNYAGIGVRYNTSAESGAFSGYSLLIGGNGGWTFRRGNTVIGSGDIDGFSPTSEYRLTVTAEERSISAKINGEEIFSAEEDGSYIRSGRIALYSAYCGNSFDDISAIQAGDSPYIDRIDSSDDRISYSGGFSADYPSYTYYGHSRSVCDTSSRVYSGAAPFSEDGFIYTGFSDTENGKITRLLYIGSSALFISGSFSDELTVSLDGSGLSTTSSDSIVIPPVSGSGMHTVLISDSADAEIYHITTSPPAEKGCLSFGFTGTGFGLVGESSESALIDIYIDGELYEENVITPKAASRQCFYSCTGLEYSSHTAEIRIKGGIFSLDAAETETKTKLIRENDNVKAEFSAAAEEKVTETEAVTSEDSVSSMSEESAVPAESAESPEENRSVKYIISFIIAAAAAALVYIFFPKEKK